MSLIDAIDAWKTKPKESRLKVSEEALVLGVDYDLIEYSYPTNKTEVIDYKLNAVLVRTITVTYLTAAKKDIDTVTVV